jgi:Zn-ribbon protein, possibly nucleic acid-binding
MDRDRFKKHMLLIHSDKISKYLMNRINGYVVILFLGAIILNIVIFFYFNSLTFLSSVENRLDFMVFILTIILVDATLSLLSFTYILVIKEDDKGAMDLKGTEIVSDKSAVEIGYLIKNWKEGLKTKSEHLQNQKKKLLEYIDKIEKNAEISDKKQKMVDKRKNDAHKTKKMERGSRLPAYIIESKLMKISDDLNVFDDNLEELENDEIKSHLKEALNLNEKLKDLENELVENLTLLEYSMEVYNFKTLKLIGRLFFQSSISIIMGFFILGVLIYVLPNPAVLEALQSFGNIPLQLILLIATIFILDGSWSFLKAIYSFFNLYIRE